ncbi:DUF2378 family protein [Pyxidicoccus parkwayensis]|uniref:DUF2378 family protein n=1 Tax=Pyxidicoccus parkwayensis TaxID=2813578 RepID=A0ABX7P5E1_9BACT|nr:DUF2378 family protein [Pyxidicoccus parkwaysis]QSQ25661.1 DUF2378 family protein [Pyxidicoccus parkwaysis]
MTNRIVFEHTVEALFIRGLGERVTPELKSRLRDEGLDLDRKLLPGYPQERFTRWLQCSARSLHPDTSEEDALCWLGERLVDGYKETAVGSALFGVLRLLGPRRMLERTQKNFRSGNSYTEVRTTLLGEREMELWMNELDIARHFTRGTMLAGMRACGAKEPRIDVLRHDTDGTTYRVRWSA